MGVGDFFKMLIEIKFSTNLIQTLKGLERTSRFFLDPIIVYTSYIVSYFTIKNYSKFRMEWINTSVIFDNL